MPVILDPEQRAQVIAKRDRLLTEINQILALSDDERRQQSRINRLQINHGREEVERLLIYMMELLNTETEDLDAFHYQRYHETYRHFGGSRPALDVDQWQALNDEFTGLHVRVVSATHVGEPVGGSPLSQKEQKRYAQLKDTLLNDSFLWDDITPKDSGQHNLPSSAGDDAPVPQAAKCRSTRNVRPSQGAHVQGRCAHLRQTRHAHSAPERTAPVCAGIFGRLHRGPAHRGCADGQRGRLLSL